MYEQETEIMAVAFISSREAFITITIIVACIAATINKYGNYVRTIVLTVRIFMYHVLQK